MTKSSTLADRNPDPVPVRPMPAINNWSIVLVGSFNPGIFHPAWFDLHGVVQKGIAETAQIGVVDVTKSNVTLGDIIIDVEPEIFEMSTAYAPEIRLLDFAARIFGELLPQTEIRGFGVQRYVHFNAASAEKREEMFRELAPRKYWGSFGKRISDERDHLAGGLRSIIMRETLEDDESCGYMDVTVQPSAALAGTEGIFVSVNRYYEMKNITVRDGAAKAISKLGAVFACAVAASDETIHHFVGRAG